MSTEDLLHQAIALLNEANQRLNEMGDRLDRMEGLKKDRVSKTEAAKILGVSPRTIEDYRRDHWQQDIHYFPQGRGAVYNRALLEDWQQNRFNPSAHQRAIDQWACSHPQAQKRRRSA